MPARRPGRVLLPFLLLSGACSESYHPVQAPTATPALAAGHCLAPLQPMVAVSVGAEGAFPSQTCLDRAHAVVAQLTPEEKYGQMLQPDRGSVRAPQDVATYGFGSILSGGGSGPTQNTPIAWAQMVNDFREQSLASRSGIPMLYGIDAVHGHNNVRGAVIFPHNIGLGATRDPDLVERIGRATAEAVAGTEMDWTFAPVLAAARDERWGRTYEAYGETAELAELLGPALIRGLQGERLGAASPSVLACAKHYLGDGHTQGGKDQGDSALDMARIESELLPAYEKAIAAGVGSVMVSYSSVLGTKMHCHGPLLNDTLKGKLGFRGFIVSDWAAVEQLPGQYPEQLAAAVNAGVDMIMAPKAHTGVIDVLGSLVPKSVPQARIDDAVTRIIATKCELNLLAPDRFAKDRSGKLAVSQSLATVGSSAHRQLAREAVRKSLVLLKNDGVLPLDSQTRVHVAGRHGDDIGLQSGGWTITWQGERGNVTPGTTIVQALRAELGPSQVSFADAAPADTAPDVNLLVIGERPYAEGKGDDPKLELPEEAHRLAAQLKAQGVPLVVVLITGRPVILGDLAELADGLVAAWLPGSEGAGVADALSGRSGFTGQLPHSWPRTLDQVPINIGDADYDPLFPYGFGIRTEPAQLAPVKAATGDPS